MRLPANSRVPNLLPLTPPPTPLFCSQHYSTPIYAPLPACLPQAPICPSARHPSACLPDNHHSLSLMQQYTMPRVCVFACPCPPPLFPHVPAVLLSLLSRPPCAPAPLVPPEPVSLSRLPLSLSDTPNCLRSAPYACCTPFHTKRVCPPVSQSHIPDAPFSLV